MRRLARIVILIIIVSLLVWAGINIIGANIPSKRLVERTITISQPVEIVWDILLDHDSAPTWQKSLKKIEITSREGNIFRYKAYTKEGFTLEIEETFYPDQNRIVSTIINKDLPFGGTWNISIKPAQMGCAVTVKSNVYVDSKFWRFLLKYVLGESYWVDTFLTELQTRANSV